MNAPARALALLLALLALVALAPAAAQEADESYYVEGRVERLLPRDPLGEAQGRQLEVRLSSGELVRAEDDGERFRPGEQVELYRTRVGRGPTRPSSTTLPTTCGGCRWPCSPSCSSRWRPSWAGARASRPCSGWPSRSRWWCS